MVARLLLANIKYILEYMMRQGDALSWFYVSCASYQGFPSGTKAKISPANAGDAGGVGSIPGLGSSPGGGNDNPLQYSYLENPKDGRAWWATVHGVAKSRTRHLFLIYSASIRSTLFLFFIVPIFEWNVPLVSLIFLKRSLVFPILLFSSISLHWLLLFFMKTLFSRRV